MKTVTYYEIVCSTYHNQPVLRLRYEVDGADYESSLYPAEELNEILHHWREGTLLGSFGVGTVLAEDAHFQLTSS